MASLSGEFSEKKLFRFFILIWRWEKRLERMSHLGARRLSELLKSAWIKQKGEKIYQ